VTLIAALIARKAGFGDAGSLSIGVPAIWDRHCDHPDLCASQNTIVSNANH
jgi:hypothetical protein